MSFYIDLIFHLESNPMEVIFLQNLTFEVMVSHIVINTKQGATGVYIYVCVYTHTHTHTHIYTGPHTQ